MSSPRIRIAAVGLAVGLALSAAACGSDSKSAATESTTAPTMATDGTTAPTMATTAGLTKDNFGSGCAAVPTSGAGSFAGMAQDPAATAASNNPALSTLVAAVNAAKPGRHAQRPRPVHHLRPEQRRLRQDRRRPRSTASWPTPRVR